MLPNEAWVLERKVLSDESLVVKKEALLDEAWVMNEGEALPGSKKKSVTQ